MRGEGLPQLRNQQGIHCSLMHLLMLNEKGPEINDKEMRKEILVLQHP